MKYRCLLVDDEALALDILEEYINRLDQLELVAKFQNPVEAFEMLQQEKIDLLFVDIQMPHLSGLELIKNLSNPPKIILTTAFRDYAVEGFELNVADYLLKPISFERFLKSVSRITSLPSYDKVYANQGVGEQDDLFLYVKSDKKMIKIFIKDILFIESLGSYIQIFTPEKKIVCYKRISEFEEKLSPQGFYRVHRSFVVSLNKIDTYSASVIEIGTHKIPIGRNHKNDFIDKMRKLKSIDI